jgi:superfamily II DNA helicase RecQ
MADSTFTPQDRALLHRVADMLDAQAITLARIESKLSDVPARTATPSTPELSPEAASLFDRLREWRHALAQSTGKSAFTIIKNAPLARVAEERPTTALQLAGIIGVGNAEKYADAILPIVNGQPNGEPW